MDSNEQRINHQAKAETDMSIKIVRRAGPLFLLAIVALNWLFILLDYPGYINCLKHIMAHDGSFESTFWIIIRIHYTLLIAAIWMFAFKSPWESVTRASPTNRACYWITGMLIISYFLVRPRYDLAFYCEDGFFEALTVIAALSASVILLAGIRRRDARAIIAIKLVLALLFFLFGMEETSWGQRLFGWKTPASFAELNYQGETNLHNLFNPYFIQLYFFFNLGLSIFLYYSEQIGAKLRELPGMEKFATLIPSREFKLYGLIFLWLTVESLFYGGELTEEIFAVFGLAYALSLLIDTKPPAADAAI